MFRVMWASAEKPGAVSATYLRHFKGIIGSSILQEPKLYYLGVKLQIVALKLNPHGTAKPMVDQIRLQHTPSLVTHGSTFDEETPSST